MNKLKGITVVHKDIVITYDERDNKWVFELHGKERKLDSLKASKELINKPAPKSKVLFERQMAWMSHYAGDNVEAVTVTSIADNERHNEPEFWIVDGKGDRRKVFASKLYSASPKNTPIVNRIKEKQAVIDDIQNEIETLHKKLVRLEIPKQ